MYSPKVPDYYSQFQLGIGQLCCAQNSFRTNCIITATSCLSQSFRWSLAVNVAQHREKWPKQAFRFPSCSSLPIPKKSQRMSPSSQEQRQLELEIFEFNWSLRAPKSLYFPQDTHNCHSCEEQLLLVGKVVGKDLAKNSSSRSTDF